MTITHIRRGFATNSSSTHSIMELEPGQRLPDSFNAGWNESSHIEEEDFIAADRQSRINYLHAMASDAARDAGDWRDEKRCYVNYLQLASVIPGKPLGQEEMNNTRLDSLSGYAIPRKVHSTDMDVDFFERIARILLSKNIVIFGGPCGDPVRGEDLDGRYVYLLNAMHTVSRRISENEWTLLSLYDGTKYSVRFDDDDRQTAAPVQTTRALEMADVSITNSCTRQCPFCYRASEPGKPQTDIENLKAVVKGLKETDALEMVIGGGEPTEHPDFYRFLKETDFGDLAVSFTTRDLDFMHSLATANKVEESEALDTIRSKIKAIGLSVRSAKEVKEAESNFTALFNNDDWHRADNPQMVFHVIPDTGWEELIDAITEGKHSLLLLGMKFTGRNEGASRKAYMETLDAMLKDDRIIRHVHDSFFRRRARLGVDTKFIVDAQAIAPDWLKQFHWKSWTDTEGARSVFIDLVDKTMAPCSFGGKSIELDGYNGRSLQQAFDSIEVYRPETFKFIQFI